MEKNKYSLKYKTRGDSTPQGKPKVYFCCHPEDFDFLFESTSDEILERQNCALWYASDANVPRDEDFLSELSQMQLFVMPVTAKLMYTKNYALDVEFRFAIEHHIPVIPIMQESGLDQIFNKKCGNIHYLDKNLYDVTAIPYEQKLDEYLSSVLVGDEFAKKIREAFIAYIFLSYRKKDRKYAKELMSLIHKNEFCREIAIWYDEFLIPGEDFNDAIKRAIEKSDLFVMAVTPNLVCESNYILTTEYPMAKEAGKLIIPAEMVKTDRASLIENYNQLPTPIDAHNEKELSEILLSTIHSLALKESEGSPEHTFFIGLAYLEGIDVEVDHERALSLITSAADEGLREAIEKLVNMYKNGKGVERSYETALMWRERLVNLSEREYRLSPDEERLHTLFWDIVECGEDYFTVGRVEEAGEKYEYAKKLLEASELIDQSDKIMRDLSVVTLRLGIIYEKEKKQVEAKLCLENALTLCEKMYQKTASVQSRKDLATLYRIIGIPGRSGERDLYYRERAIEMAEELVRDTGEKSSRQLLFDSYVFHGVMLKVSRGRDLNAAKACYEKALSVAEGLAEDYYTPNERRNLGNIYGLLGSMCKTLGDPDGMWVYYKKQLAINESLVKETNAVQDLRTLSGNYIIRAFEYANMAENDKALDYHKRAIEIREKLAYETESVDMIKDLCSAYESYADFFKNTGRADKAAEFYRKSISSWEKLSRMTTGSKAYTEMARGYCNLGEVTNDISAFERAFEINKMLLEKFPSEANYHNGRLNFIRATIEKMKK